MEKLAERYLSRLDSTRRPIDPINFVFSFNARKRGNETGMLERLRPLEAYWDAQLHAGIDTSFPHWFKAIFAFLRGATDEAYGHAERAFSLDPGPPRVVDAPYRLQGWGDIRRFVALREQYEAYIRAERLKLLAVLPVAKTGSRPGDPCPGPARAMWRAETKADSRHQQACGNKFSHSVSVW